LEKAIKIALSALGARLLLAPFFAHVWDVNTLQTSLEGVLQGVNPYSFMASQTAALTAQSGIPVSFQGYDYLPHALLIFLPFYQLYLYLGGNLAPILNVYDFSTHVSSASFNLDVNLFLLFLKLPIILADGIVVYLLATRNLGVGRFYAYSPYVILVSAVWGNFDGFVALFLLLAILFVSKHPRYAGLFYGLSLMKLYTILLLPAFCVELWREARFTSLRNFLVGAVISQLPTVYWLLLDPKSMLADIISFNGARISGGVTPLNVLWTIPSLAFTQGAIDLAFVIFAVAYIFFLITALRSRLDLVDSSILVLATFLMFGTVVNEQYLVAALPLMALRYQKPALALSAIAFVFAMFNATPVYFAMPLLFELNLSGFVTAFYGFIGTTPVYVTRALILFSLGLYFFLRSFDLIRWILGRRDSKPSGYGRWPQSLYQTTLIPKIKNFELEYASLNLGSAFRREPK
jgi:hypothetical protein